MRFKLLAWASLILLLAPFTASAHNVGFDKSFTATLHFAPDDKPAAGIESDMRFIDLKDTSGNFTPEDCICQAEIIQNGRRLGIITLRGLGPDLAGKYVFSGPGNYEIKLIGQPKVTANFAAFSITHPLRIDRAVASRTNAPSDTYILLGGLLILMGLTYFAVRFLRSERNA